MAVTRPAQDTIESRDLAAVGERRGRLRVVRRMVKHTGGMIGFVMLLLLIAVAIFAPVFAPYNPIEISADVLKSPSASHIMGTDNFGRDIFSRVIYGARVSLRMGFIAIAIATVIGTTMGIVAGTYGGWIDSSLMRLVDAMMAFPGILLALAITAMLGTGLRNAMVAVGISFIPSFARLVRASTLQVRGTTYVEAAQSIGCRTSRLIYRHILPNVLTPVLVLATLGVASAILIGAALSFLGLGAQPPTAEWGIMLADGRQFMRSAWWIMAFPGLAITITVMAANLIGDGLRDAFDPRLRI
ncbi:MAG: ABC transporter permease [Nitrolancea sp.]